MAAYRRDGTVQNPVGYAMQGVDVYVCTQPANTAVIPPTPLATIYTDATGTVQATNPVVTDGNGNFFFYAAAGTYTLVFFDPLGRLPTEVFIDQEVLSPGGGTVTSVAMTGDGTVYQTSVSGSPITTSGTLAPALVSQTANRVLAGPTSGPAAAPTFRALVSGDLPGGLGTVSSVAATLSVPNIFSSSVTGSPITTSGTLAFSITLQTQTANLFLAGPASGAASAPSFRTMAAADIFGTTAVTFSATPTFNAATFASPTFTMTLTGNVTSSTVSNPIPGQIITFVLTQDATGSRTFAWPTNFKAASNVDGTASSISVQSFVYDGTNWRATGPGSFNGN